MKFVSYQSGYHNSIKRSLSSQRVRSGSNRQQQGDTLFSFAPSPAPARLQITQNNVLLTDILNLKERLQVLQSQIDVRQQETIKTIEQFESKQQPTETVSKQVPLINESIQDVSRISKLFSQYSNDSIIHYEQNQKENYQIQIKPTEQQQKKIRLSDFCKFRCKGNQQSVFLKKLENAKKENENKNLIKFQSQNPSKHRISQSISFIEKNQSNSKFIKLSQSVESKKSQVSVYLQILNKKGKTANNQNIKKK